MKVKDIKPTLDEKNKIFADLQRIEIKLRDDKQLRDELNDKLGTHDVHQTIVEARVSFYNNEISKLEELIDNAEIQE